MHLLELVQAFYKILAMLKLDPRILTRIFRKKYTSKPFYQALTPSSWCQGFLTNN